MKTISTFAILLMVSVAGYAQSKPGFAVVGSIGLNNVNREPQMMTVGAEAGYFGKTLGLTATYNNVAQKHFTKASSYGLKAYGKFAKVDALSLYVVAEGDVFIKAIDKNITSKFSYKPGLFISMPLAARVDVGLGVHEFIYRQKWHGVDGTRFKTGATLNFIFRPFGK